MRILSAGVIACIGAQLLCAAPHSLLAPEALRFEENRGQAGKPVRYLSRGRNHLLTLAPGLAALSLRRHAGADTLRMQLQGANRDAEMKGLEPVAATSNYFLGASPEQWRTGIQNYARVEYKDVYRGIDLIYYGNESRWNTISWWRRAAIPRQFASDFPEPKNRQ
jgi:hypothetical protein